MTNKKLKMAAMSVALTACVAASPLAANADAPEAAPEKKGACGGGNQERGKHRRTSG